MWQRTHLLSNDPFELSGFELIFPTLLGEAQELGLDVPNHTYGYGEIQTAKLQLIPPEMLYSPHISTVYSLEFLGQSGNTEKLQKALTNNGSLGTSPATTAYYLSLHQNDARAMKYLETVLAHSVGAISVYPFRTFELSWVLNNLAFSGIPLRTFADEDIWQELQAAMGRDGAGMDPEFGIPDGDTTSVCCRVLLEAGYEVEPLILAEFEDKREGIFHTWEYERNFSVSTNVHALEALNLMPEYPNHQQIQEQLIIKLLNNREYNVYWKDKWHASPYYTTSHALLALLPQGSSVIHACHHAVDWLTHTQHNDGSWGYFGVGTLEETAYTLTALLHYNRYQQIDLGSIHSGVHYLIKTYEEFKTKLDLACPELWIAKSLFAPYDVIRSAVLSTLIVYNKMFGRLPG